MRLLLDPGNPDFGAKQRGRPRIRAFQRRALAEFAWPAPQWLGLRSLLRPLLWVLVRLGDKPGLDKLEVLVEILSALLLVAPA